jgi:hypothetical protein
MKNPLAKTRTATSVRRLGGPARGEGTQSPIGPAGDGSTHFPLFRPLAEKGAPPRCVNAVVRGTTRSVVEGAAFAPELRAAWQPTSACGAPLWMKMVVARADLSEPTQRRSREADITAVACDPDWQSGPAAIEAPFFVAPGNGSTHSSVSNVPAASRSPSNGRRR